MSTRVEPQSFPDTPAFLVGVTGYMALEKDQEKIDAIKTQLKLLLRFLRHGPNHKENDESPSLLDLLVKELVPDGEAKATLALRHTFRQILADWPALKSTPIVVMCGLAPGADTLAADVLLKDPEFSEGNGFYLRAPLPFPNKIYRTASTFCRSQDDKSSVSNDERQKTYDELVKALGSENTFAVRLAQDRGHTRDKICHC